jgi:hypothetical protein
LHSAFSVSIFIICFGYVREKGASTKYNLMIEAHCLGTARARFRKKDSIFCELASLRDLTETELA